MKFKFNEIIKKYNTDKTLNPKHRHAINWYLTIFLFAKMKN